MTNSVFKKSKHVVIIAGLLALSVLLGVYIASQRLSEYKTQAEVQVAEQKVVINTIAETIARNGADAVTESIITDCPTEQRLRFDFLLGQLDSGLTVVELQELDSLFSSCASVFANRKALMTARFAREVEVFENFVSLLDILTDRNELEEHQLSDWKALVAEEEKQSELFAQLVTAQKQIILALLDGKSPNSEEILTVLSDVNEIREALSYSKLQAGQIRSRVTSL
jgi:hypothetical protein